MNGDYQQPLHRHPRSAARKSDPYSEAAGYFPAQGTTPQAQQPPPPPSIDGFVGDLAGYFHQQPPPQVPLYQAQRHEAGYQHPAPQAPYAANGYTPMQGNGAYEYGARSPGSSAGAPSSSAAAPPQAWPLPPPVHHVLSAEAERERRTLAEQLQMLDDTIETVGSSSDQIQTPLKQLE